MCKRAGLSGTNLVNVSFNLSGATAPIFVSVSVSTNGGLSYDFTSLHLSGDGINNPVASGTGRHIVWDAGADLPGMLTSSARVRVSIQVGDYVSKGDSTILKLDTRSVPTGTFTGRVLDSGSSLGQRTGAGGRNVLCCQHV